MIGNQELIKPGVRSLAALSHFLGFIMAMYLWITYREKSHYLRIQALQVMVFNFFAYAIVLSLLSSTMAVLMTRLIFGIAGSALLGNPGHSMAGPVGLLAASLDAMPAFIPILIILLGSFVFVIRLASAIQTWRGKDFHCPWLGAIAEHWT
jgi:uncharacterized membrane protein